MKPGEMYKYYPKLHWADTEKELKEIQKELDDISELDKEVRKTEKVQWHLRRLRTRCVKLGSIRFEIAQYLKDNVTMVELHRFPGQVTPEDQVDEWLKGNAVHNNDRWIYLTDDDDVVVRVEKMDGGECCPDFSCCSPKLLWPEEVRQSFKAADTATRWKMASMGVTAMINDEGLTARVIDGSDIKNIH